MGFIITETQKLNYFFNKTTIFVFIERVSWLCFVEMALRPCPEKESLTCPPLAKHGMTIDCMKKFKVESSKKVYHKYVQSFLTEMSVEM